MLGSTILVIEEDPLVRQVMNSVLRRAGFFVQLASGSEEARQVFEEHQTELALMVVDITSGGLEFVNSIPTLHPRVPVLFTTTHAEPDLAAVVQQGFPWLSKPFTSHGLIDSMRRFFPAKHA